jgi:hypothetical protein
MEKTMRNNKDRLIAAEAEMRLLSETVIKQHGEIEKLRTMTLRDYFAGQALVGLCGTHEGVARNAYKIADAMLEEREKLGD